jgi:hypothetical protein
MVAPEYGARNCRGAAYLLLLFINRRIIILKIIKINMK